MGNKENSNIDDNINNNLNDIKNNNTNSSTNNNINYIKYLITNKKYTSPQITSPLWTDIFYITSLLFFKYHFI